MIRIQQGLCLLQGLHASLSEFYAPKARQQTHRLHSHFSRGLQPQPHEPVQEVVEVCSLEKETLVVDLEHEQLVFEGELGEEAGVCWAQFLKENLCGELVSQIVDQIAGHSVLELFQSLNIFKHALHYSSNRVPLQSLVPHERPDQQGRVLAPSPLLHLSHHALLHSQQNFVGSASFEESPCKGGHLLSVELVQPSFKNLDQFFEKGVEMLGSDDGIVGKCPGHLLQLVCVILVKKGLNGLQDGSVIARIVSYLPLSLKAELPELEHQSLVRLTYQAENLSTLFVVSYRSGDIRFDTWVELVQVVALQNLEQLGQLSESEETQSLSGPLLKARLKSRSEVESRVHIDKFYYFCRRNELESGEYPREESIDEVLFGCVELLYFGQIGEDHQHLAYCLGLQQQSFYLLQKSFLHFLPALRQN